MCSIAICGAPGTITFLKSVIRVPVCESTRIAGDNNRPVLSPIRRFDFLRHLYERTGKELETVPCCALAAFILGQVLIGLDGIKRFFGIAVSAAPDNPATEWRLGTVTTPRKSSPRVGFRWAAVVAILEIALVAGRAPPLPPPFLSAPPSP